MKRLAYGLSLFLLLASPAWAQSIDLNSILPSGEASASGRMIQLIALITVLSLAPGLLIMVTSFIRFSIAFSFLRSGMGLQSTPSNMVMISLALFMTFYVMGPTFDQAWKNGVQPLLDNQITEAQAYERVASPFRSFMLQHVRDEDIGMFSDLAIANLNATEATSPDEVEMRVLIPSFMISELRRGFEMGFLIALPFLVIDLIVATITMSMGMMMLPPTAISLPFKALFFVLIDGWNILVGSLIRSFF
ncbi:flagellar biosynthetic protein FliP [Cohaesibacter marisflavi]|uniref:Flagellar biosynthetic protein FliP n=1 Tax=Cohaesibacter marisflavi TaxID=655353 RepID=A0A1I5C7T5_9HYPH|nr:flagellar type III secretion system pore protein FliP [Cohaesibacter marisflavi]SFN83120.1 flagellar biosynthetic protein FliP [Cohaesibacter marisflavi]